MTLYTQLFKLFNKNGTSRFISNRYPRNERKKAALAPKNIEAWRNFSNTVFEAGALDEKTKQLIAIAVAHTTQCPYCIRSHTKQALRMGVTDEQIMEAVWVAAEMRAGAAYTHGNLAMDEIEKFNQRNNAKS